MYLSAHDVENGSITEVKKDRASERGIACCLLHSLTGILVVLSISLAFLTRPQ